MKKVLSVMFITICVAVLFTSCEFSKSGIDKDRQNTKDIADILQASQPTPTDIEYSLERYNLIRRVYWVNGMREKAVTLPCPVEKPLGYIVLFCGNTIVGRFVVDGKVSSLNSYLTPDSDYYEISDSSSRTFMNEWLADADGSYGTNDNGIFFFTPDGKYVEWTGTYLYTDIPITVENPVVQISVD